MRRTWVFLGALTSLVLLSEEVFAADIADPASRSTRGTAYVHTGGQVFGEVGLLGVRSTDLFATLGAGYGIGWGLEVTMNLAHTSAALFNLGAKWNFLDHRWASLSIGFDPMFIAGDLVWLPPYDRLLSGFEVWVLPVVLGYTGRPLEWLELDLLASYTDVETGRDADPNALIFRSQIGVSRFSLRPGVRVHLMGKLSLYAQVELPVWFDTKFIDLDQFGDSVLVTAGARAMASEHWFLDFGLNGGAAVAPLYDSDVYPRMSLEARF